MKIQPVLTYDVRTEKFFFVCDKETRMPAKEAGFRYNWNQKLWYTNIPAIAARCLEYADEKANEILNSCGFNPAPEKKKEKTIVCISCGEEKPLSDFHRRSTKKNTYHFKCKVCTNKYIKKWREKNAENKKKKTLICRICNEEKPISEFHKASSKKNGYKSACRSCVSKQMKEYNEKKKQESAPVPVVQTETGIVELIGGIPKTTSLIVAETFGKEHKNVLRDIEKLECSQEFRRLNFEQSSYTNVQNKSQPMTEITRDGFVFLVGGFTGKKAAQFKEKYIAAFNAMEQQLKTQVPVANWQKRMQIIEEIVRQNAEALNMLKGEK